MAPTATLESEAQCGARAFIIDEGADENLCCFKTYISPFSLFEEWQTLANPPQQYTIFGYF